MPNKPSNLRTLSHTRVPAEVSYVLLDGKKEWLALISWSAE